MILGGEWNSMDCMDCTPWKKNLFHLKIACLKENKMAKSWLFLYKSPKCETVNFVLTCLTNGCIQFDIKVVLFFMENYFQAKLVVPTKLLRIKV